MLCFVVIIMLALIAPQAFAGQNVLPSPDEEWTVVQKCDNMGFFCTLSATARSGKKVWIDREGFPRFQGVRWVGNQLLRIDYVYGSTPFVATKFWRPDKASSRRFEYVIAVNGDAEVVAVAEPNGAEKGVINLYKIFGDDQKTLQVIDKDFGCSTYELDAEFLADGNLQVAYPQDDHVGAKKEVIKIDYQ